MSSTFQILLVRVILALASYDFIKLSQQSAVKLSEKKRITTKPRKRIVGTLLEAFIYYQHAHPTINNGLGSCYGQDHRRCGPWRKGCFLDSAGQTSCRGGWGCVRYRYRGARMTGRLSLVRVVQYWTATQHNVLSAETYAQQSLPAHFVRQRIVVRCVLGST